MHKKMMGTLLAAAILSMTVTACGAGNTSVSRETTTETAAETTESTDETTAAAETTEAGEGDDLESGSRSAVEGYPTQTTENPLAEIEKPVPEEYLTEAENQGTLTTIQYETIDRAGDGSKLEKEAMVYLPYGYDETDADTRYDIVYLMHGWTGNNSIFFQYDDSNALKNTLDHMIENGDVKPFILVTPTFDRNNATTSLEDSVSEIKVFREELVNELIPAVETEFHTYAESTDDEGLTASRDHRVFAGFSLGATVTWDVFLNDMAYFRYYMPMSGSSWALEDQASSPEITSETAAYLAKQIRDEGYTSDDFYIYTAVGSNDVAFEMTDNMAAGLLEQEDMFNDSNMDYGFQNGAVHWWDAMPTNLYNGLPRIFPVSEN